MNKTETPTPVVLVLTRRQAEALASLVTRSQMHDRWVDSVRTQLPRSLAELNYQRSSAAGSAFAAAQAVVDQTASTTPGAAERERKGEAGTYAAAERVASDAAQAAEIVAAAIASGGDAATALAALQVSPRARQIAGVGHLAG